MSFYFNLQAKNIYETTNIDFQNCNILNATSDQNINAFNSCIKIALATGKINAKNTKFNRIRSGKSTRLIKSSVNSLIAEGKVLGDNCYIGIASSQKKMELNNCTVIEAYSLCETVVTDCKIQSLVSSGKIVMCDSYVKKFSAEKPVQVRHSVVKEMTIPMGSRITQSVIDVLYIKKSDSSEPVVIENCFINELHNPCFTKIQIIGECFINYINTHTKASV